MNKDFVVYHGCKDACCPSVNVIKGANMHDELIN